MSEGGAGSAAAAAAAAAVAAVAAAAAAVAGARAPGFGFRSGFGQGELTHLAELEHPDADHRQSTLVRLLHDLVGV